LEIGAAFAALVRHRVGAVLVASDAAFFTSQRARRVTLAARHKIPAIYSEREFAKDGDLTSYGTSLADVNRMFGVYTSQILKGASPADLPVVRPTRFEFVINVATARELGLEIPSTLLARADEVIE